MNFVDPHHTPIDLEEIFKQIQAQLDLVNSSDDAPITSFSEDKRPDSGSEDYSPNPSIMTFDELQEQGIDIDEDLLNELFSLMKESLEDLLEEDEFFHPFTSSEITLDDEESLYLDDLEIQEKTNYIADYDDDSPRFISFQGRAYRVEPIQKDYIPEYYGDWESFFLIN